MQIIDQGIGNRVIGAHDHLDGSVEFTGDHATVEIADAVHAVGLSLSVGVGSVITIGAGCSLGAFRAHLADDCRLQIGKGCGFADASILMHEPSACSIGDGCLLSNDVTITTSDMHAIHDRRTGKRINAAASVFIGEHVWLGQGVLILKGAYISNEVVIGARAVVTGRIPWAAVAAGNPARVVRKNVQWRFDLPTTLHS